MNCECSSRLCGARSGSPQIRIVSLKFVIMKGFPAISHLGVPKGWEVCPALVTNPINSLVPQPVGVGGED